MDIEKEMDKTLESLASDRKRALEDILDAFVPPPAVAACVKPSEMEIFRKLIELGFHKGYAAGLVNGLAKVAAVAGEGAGPARDERLRQLIDCMETLREDLKP